MGFLLRWDTPIKTIPPEGAKRIPPQVLGEIQGQGQVFSLHPQCPYPVAYVGTGAAGHGFVNDYYVDGQGVYWHESRLPDEPVVVKFIYGGGTGCRKRRGKAGSFLEGAEGRTCRSMPCKKQEGSGMGRTVTFNRVTGRGNYGD